MAHFRGTVAGSRKIASRLGTKQSGMTVEAQSWEGKVTVRLYRLETAGATGQDYAEVSLAPHHDNGRHVILYVGPVSGMDAHDGRIGPTRPMSQLGIRVVKDAGERRQEVTNNA